MTADRRFPQGGLVSRAGRCDFTFNGKHLSGYDGDTLASALLANDIHLVGRSFKYHRPRGIFSAGSEEPNALMTIGTDNARDPNTLATTAELYDGMIARAQNYVGSLGFDLMAINDFMSPFMGAGFYYKTFMWPPAFWEKFYEPIIRRGAGLGALSGAPDPDCYDKGWLHADLLVIGGGISGLIAGLIAARSGLKTIIADDDFHFGGEALSRNETINDLDGNSWVNQVLAELLACDHVRLMQRTTVFGVYDHGVYGALERACDHLPHDKRSGARQVMWKIMAKRSILASGAIERSIGFANNDRPGVMLAGATREYAHRYAVATGGAVTVFTNNDDGVLSAKNLAARGVNLAAVIDTRDASPCHAELPKTTQLIKNGRIIKTHGYARVRAVTLASGEKISTDCLAVSGGWSPSLHLTCHHRGRPRWDSRIAAFIPAGDLPPGMQVVGAAAGKFSTHQCLISAMDEANKAVAALGGQPVVMDLPRAEDRPSDTIPVWLIPEGQGRKFIDLQNDVTSKDIALAHREGYRSIEHLKRYTTLGMATDQGKTSNVLGLGVMAEVSGREMDAVGTTIFRPPYTPVAIAAFAGRARGNHFRPTRLTPAHHWAQDQGAVFVEAGLWLRPQWFPREGETHWRQSVDREVLATRSSVGVCDVSTLGKIDIQGADAGTFIERVYANGFSTLSVGKIRYGLMLREDGFVMDDGTTARLDEHHYVMTTTTANAAGVYRHLEFCHQCLWPELDVQIISITDQYAQYAIAGPNSRKLLSMITDGGTDLSDEAFPFMACGEISICGGVKARLFRVSFSGERAYEISVSARYGAALMHRLLEIGKPLEITPYGTEALGVMRIEKGHPAGNELNGQTSAHHLGFGRILSNKKDYIGKVMAGRHELTREDGIRLVGIKPVNPRNEIYAGAHILPIGGRTTIADDQGWVSSVAFSPMLKTMIGLAFIENGTARLGEVVRAVDLLRGSDIEVELTSAHFFDPEGRRLHG